MTEEAIQNRPGAEYSHILQSFFQSIAELGELREFAQGASLEIVQLSPGRMQGCLAHILFPQSSLHLNRFNLAARGRGGSSADRWSFIIFPRGITGAFNGFPLDSGVMIVYPPQSEFEGTILGAAEFHDWIFTVMEDELAETYFALTRQELTLLKSQVQCLRLSPPAIDQLRTFASNLMLIAEQVPAPFEDLKTGQSLHRQLVELLARALMTSGGSRCQESGLHIPHWRIVRKVEEFFEANLAEDLSLSELCRAASVSDRTLRRAFANVLGINPNRLLKTLRMNRAYRELERADPLETTVAAVAMRWGLTHLSRFAQEYHQFFGELPSVTLKRKAGR